MKLSVPVQRLVVTMVLALSVLGCSKTKSGRIPVYPTSGKVTLKGQPIEGADLVFYASSPELTGPGTVPPVAVTDASGIFHLRSYDPDDGAPRGKFNVTITWPDFVADAAATE